MNENVLLRLLHIKWFLLRGILSAWYKLVHDLNWLKAPLCQLMPVQTQPELLTYIDRLSLILEDWLMDLAHLLHPLDLLLPHPILILDEHRRLVHMFFLVDLTGLMLIRYCLGWVDYLEILLIVVNNLLNYWYLHLIPLDCILRHLKLGS